MKVGPAFARTVRHFFPELNDWLDEAPDTRRQEGVLYSGRFLQWFGLLLFLGKLGSRRQLDYQFREAGTYVLDNLNRLAQTAQTTIPCNDTLDDYLGHLGAGPLAALRARMIRRLIRMRVLDPGRVQGRLVVAVDGTGYLTFRQQHCEHCLKRQCGEQVVYAHQALEAKILGPAATVLSLGTEFIDNRDQADGPPTRGEEKRKQDCELKAARRLFGQIRKEFPQLSLCQTADALYACGTGFQIAKEFNTSFVFVFKKGSIPTLWEEFETLLGLSPDNRVETTTADGWRHVYRWVNDLPYTDSMGRQWQLQGIRYEGEGPQGERTEWAWLVSPDLKVNARTVVEIAEEVGRARWRVENQGFNTQKNSGLNLEHAYSEGEHFGAYYLLLQIAHWLLQLLEKGSLLRTLAREWGKRSVVSLLGSLKNLAGFLVESLRNLLWPEEVFGPGGRIQIRLDSS